MARRPRPVAWRPANNGGLLQALHEVATLTAGARRAPGGGPTCGSTIWPASPASAATTHVEARRATARDVLMRMNDPWLTARAAGVPGATAAGRRSAQELHPWASGEVSLDTLAASHRALRSDRLPRDADAIAELRLRMKWSADERLVGARRGAQSPLPQRQHPRVAVSSEFLNRMIPAQEPARSRRSTAASPAPRFAAARRPKRKSRAADARSHRVAIRPRSLRQRSARKRTPRRGPRGSATPAAWSTRSASW